MELNGEVSSPNGSEQMSDFIVLGHGSGEFRRNSDAESMEEVGQRVRQLLLENKELRENVQQNTEAMAQQYQVLKLWKDQELERQVKIKTQYNNAKEIISALREENMKLKQKQEHMERASIHTEGGEDEKMEQEMLYHQLDQLRQENEDLQKQTSEHAMLREEMKQLKQANEELLQKKMESMSQSTQSVKRMTSSSMEVNVASHETTETQTEAPTVESKNKELEVARMQANQLMQDLEALQKLKDNIEQQKAKITQERDDLMNQIYEKENITMKLLREKREVVAMNNQLNMEVDRLVKENEHLWDAEKEKVESLKNFDTVQDFSRELDQRLDVAPLPSLNTIDKETEEKTDDAELGTTSGAISIKSGELRDRAQTIQAILLQLQEQQEVNQKTSKEVSTKAQQITQLQSELEKLKNDLKEKDKEIEEAKLKCAKEIDDMVMHNVEKENKAERLAKEEKQKFEEKINSLNAEITSKVAQLEGLRKHLDNTTELYQKQIGSLNEVNEKCKSEIADQMALLATLNNSHRQQIEEMRREILHLSEAVADKQQNTMSENQQTELLQTQVNTLITDLRTESSKLEAKTKMCNDYKVEADRLSLEIQKLQTKHNEAAESMRLQIGSLQSKLHAAELESEKKRHDLDDLTRSQSQLLADYQDLFTTHDKTVREKSETENQLRQRMTQLQSESISRQEECKALKDEVRIKLEEIEDLFQRIRTMQAEKEDSSVYQIQAEVFREDFGREREARERAHEELAEAKAKLDDLVLVKQRLEAQLQQYSQQQIAQMQQRDDYVVVPQQFQLPQQQQYPQVMYPYPGPNTEGMDAFGYPQQNLSPQAGQNVRRASPSRQLVPVDKHTCPKCQQDFNDLDTLQIHVFDCLDRS